MINNNIRSEVDITDANLRQIFFGVYFGKSIFQVSDGCRIDKMHTSTSIESFDMVSRGHGQG
eukprot:CAMPEP_0116872962 /NCGR_PEP_ID=MMETSP0463-20121206/3911_1 /TAXON_ID=181622 /ORGANISM="Strombidinopsis sp, Strain SopsisLIS2011" /LENGTH=61 /DNA_ID=CAMNT_0004514105 /DNA_START=445 /DNA_END=630 /DNA_ORIENTATION=-